MRRGRAWGLGFVAVVCGVSGCSLDGLLNGDKVPDNVSDPALTKSPKGALAIYHGTVVLFRQAFGGYQQTAFGSGISSYTASYDSRSFIVESGLLADEFTSHPRQNQTEDQRLLTEGGFTFVDATGASSIYRPDESTYRILQKVRAQAGQAIGLLTDYADPPQPALVGHAYELEAYAEVFLNELYCSGVPLSTLDYNGSYTLKPGSTTTAIFTHAVALFDTALTLVDDSVRFQYLAAVGKGRALLGLGNYAAAAAAVTAVPDNYRYQVSYTATDSSRNYMYDQGIDVPASPVVGDREGTNGLDYVSAQDPRAPTQSYPASGSQPSFYGPAASLYALTGASPITLASGVEARLIEAEAALQAGDAGTWLTKLNALRTDGTFTVDSQAVVDTVVDTGVIPPDTTYDTTSFTYDTLWHAGTGGGAGLRPLADPGTENGRVDLLFRERAFWLFLTGHRQGDLRRLIRQYGRSGDQIYPTGPYALGGMVGANYGFYGHFVDLALPLDEVKDNPLVAGCLSRDAD